MSSSRKNGYTEIPHIGDVVVGHDESQALLSKSNGGNDDGNGHAKLPRLHAAGILLLGMLLGSCLVLVMKRNPQEVTVVTVEKTIERDGTLYRPICQQFQDNSLKIQVTQTSLGQPSQQWADIPCLRAPSRGIFAKPTMKKYPVPDALVRVNFSDVPAGFQPILGFGGAFTEASSLNFHRLSNQGQEAVLKLLFGKNGLGYTIGRVPMNSCDFSVKNYTFDETEDDFELHDFDTQVTHDQGMMDFIRRSQEVLKQDWGNSGSSGEDGDGMLKLFTSPWSPPSWMKKPTWQDSKTAVHAANMTYSSKNTCLREGVGPHSRYAKAWALYFSKYLTAYEQHNLSFWAVTVQNEPEFPAPWEACSYTPSTQAEFVGEHLGPRLRQDHPGVKLLIFDHNKDHVNKWVNKLLSKDSKSAPFVDGTAVHWYAGGMDRLLDGALGAANMHLMQENLRSLNRTEGHIVLGSEACHCPSTGYAGGSLDVAWTRAERYVHSMLSDLMAGSQGWTEWNLILDGIGGPNHLGNLCETTILSVPHRAWNASDDVTPIPDFEKHPPTKGKAIVGDGRTREEWNAMGMPAKYLDVGVAVQPVYFYMGHVSRFVRPGARAVRGLVHSSGADPIFRPPGTTVAGGGENDLARNGIEITTWPCEGSTRQFFDWNDNESSHISVQGHDWLGKPTKSCLAKTADEDLRSVRLVDCEINRYDSPDLAGTFDLEELEDGDYHIVVTNHPTLDRPCLVIEELANDGGAYGKLGGAPVTIGSCGDAAKWNIDSTTGVISSQYFSDESSSSEVCMTTGWPFLQMGAFRSASGKTVILLNEAKETANFALHDENGLAMASSIPPRSIQSIVLN